MEIHTVEASSSAASARKYMAEASSSAASARKYMAEASRIAASAKPVDLPTRVELHRAALKGNWEDAGKLLTNNPSLVNARITKGGETALHIAAVEGHTDFVYNLLNTEVVDLKIPNHAGVTALCFAASAGHLDIAKKMVERNGSLPIQGLIRPLYMAALQGHNEMAEYLYPKSTDFNDWDVNKKIDVLTACIDSELYGLAIKIVNERVLADDNVMELAIPLLKVLAQKPLAFCDSSRQRLWGNIAGTALRCMKLKARNTSPPSDAYTLLNLLWDRVICHDDVETAQIHGISILLFVAAESGNDVFLVELIRKYPDFLYKIEKNSNYSIFHIAVKYRHVKVFNLIYELRGFKNLMLLYEDEDKNNILHLAAQLAPPDQLNIIPGAALQMQREVLWYKEVEKIVQPSYRNMKNSNNKTPYDLFLEAHKQLMNDGEKQMKQIAKSCMLVAVLISTIIFTAAFTVPGGYNDNGVPNLQHKKLYKAFPISEVVAILASLISILMFLKILTSRFSANDFLRSLPIWLMVGVVALFVSIVAMMVAFCTSILLFQHELAVIIVLWVSFAIVPILFVILKGSLLVTILKSTFSSKWIFGSNNRLFS